MAVALCVLAAAAGSRADGSDVRNVVKSDLRNITNEVLAGVYTYATENNLTSIALPDVQQDFSAALWILTLNGRIVLTKGALSNFQKIDQYKAATASFDTDSKQLVAFAGVQLPKLKADYTFQVKLGAVKQKGHVTVSVDGTKAAAELAMSTDTLKPKLTELQVDQLGSIGVVITDGVLGWLATPIANLVALLLSDTIRNAVQGQLPALINEELDKLDIAGMLKPPADLLP